MCLSFIAAVLEVLKNNSVGRYKVCVPHLTNIDRAVKLTAEWIEAHPDSGIKAASLVTTQALAAAFPCKDPS
jgi:Rap1a immunity proteins